MVSKLAHGMRWLHSVASVTIFRFSQTEGCSDFETHFVTASSPRLHGQSEHLQRSLHLRRGIRKRNPGRWGNAMKCPEVLQKSKWLRKYSGWLHLSHLSALHLLLVPPPGMRTSSSLPKSFLWSEFVQRSTESTGCSTLSKKSMHLARCIWPESRQRCGIFRCVPWDSAEAENLSAVIASQAVCTASWTKHQ